MQYNGKQIANRFLDDDSPGDNLSNVLILYAFIRCLTMTRVLKVRVRQVFLVVSFKKVQSMV